MLTPVRPSKDEPDYKHRMRDYKQARQDKIDNPTHWGFVAGIAAPSPGTSAPTSPRAATSERKRDVRGTAGTGTTE